MPFMIPLALMIFLALFGLMSRKVLRFEKLLTEVSSKLEKMNQQISEMVSTPIVEKLQQKAIELAEFAGELENIRHELSEFHTKLTKRALKLKKQESQTKGFLAILAEKERLLANCRRLQRTLESDSKKLQQQYEKTNIDMIAKASSYKALKLELEQFRSTVSPKDEALSTAIYERKQADQRVKDAQLSCDRQEQMLKEEKRIASSEQKKIRIKLGEETARVKELEMTIRDLNICHQNEVDIYKRECDGLKQEVTTFMENRDAQLEAIRQETSQLPKECAELKLETTQLKEIVTKSYADSEKMAEQMKQALINKSQDEQIIATLRQQVQDLKNERRLRQGQSNHWTSKNLNYKRKIINLKEKFRSSKDVPDNSKAPVSTAADLSNTTENVHEGAEAAPVDMKTTQKIRSSKDSKKARFRSDLKIARKTPLPPSPMVPAAVIPTPEPLAPEPMDMSSDPVAADNIIRTYSPLPELFDSEPWDVPTTLFEPMDFTSNIDETVDLNPAAPAAAGDDINAAPPLPELFESEPWDVPTTLFEATDSTSNTEETTPQFTFSAPLPSLSQPTTASVLTGTASSMNPFAGSNIQEETNYWANAWTNPAATPPPPASRANMPTRVSRGTNPKKPAYMPGRSKTQWSVPEGKIYDVRSRR